MAPAYFEQLGLERLFFGMGTVFAGFSVAGSSLRGERKPETRARSGPGLCPNLRRVQCQHPLDNH
jgi:hypothetical protein